MRTAGKTQSQSKPLHFALAITASCIICFGSLIVVQLYCWLSGIDGLFISPWDLLLMLLIWSCAILPYSIFTALLYRWLKWTRFRTTWLLTPAILFCSSWILINLSDNLTAEGTFKMIITRPVPESLKNLRVNISRSIMGGNQWILYFELEPEDADKILHTHSFELTDLTLDNIALLRKIDDNKCALERQAWHDSGWPLPHKWGDVEIYTSSDRESHLKYFLVTDKVHRSFYVHAIFD